MYILLGFNVLSLFAVFPLASQKSDSEYELVTVLSCAPVSPAESAKIKSTSRVKSKQSYAKLTSLIKCRCGSTWFE